MEKILLIVCLLLMGCNHSSVLEGIYAKENWDHDGILYLTESANVLPIPDDSLLFYVAQEEYALALDSFGTAINKDGEANYFSDSDFVSTDTLYERVIIFKDYHKVFSAKIFDLYLIYKSLNKAHGRNHQFYLRTYDSKRVLIDSVLFALWDEENHRLFSGELTKDLFVRRLNKEGDEIKGYRILENGKIEEVENTEK